MTIWRGIIVWLQQVWGAWKQPSRYEVHGAIEGELGMKYTNIYQNFRLQPRLEAAVTLRYASVLFEETENVMEAETALSKGITLCERNRLVDLKYSMQHLLVRVMFSKNSKASLKTLDAAIHDTEVYQQHAWLYAFRFLRASLLLGVSPRPDLSSAVQTLRSISTVADMRGDSAIFAVASVLEVLVLLQKGSIEALEEAQRALAGARSRQLDSWVSQLPQVDALISILDTTCSTLHGNNHIPPAHGSMKTVHPIVEALQMKMEQLQNMSSWTADGSFFVPLTSGEGSKRPPTAPGILTVDDSGVSKLHFRWLPKEDVLTIADYLCGVVKAHTNSYDKRKGEQFAEQFLTAGLKISNSEFIGLVRLLILSNIFADYPSDFTSKQTNEPISMASFADQFTWRKTLQCFMRIRGALLACSRYDWQEANRTLKQMRKEINSLGEAAPPLLEALLLYLRGTMKQGTGDVSGALSIFQSPVFTLTQTQFVNPQDPHDPLRDLALLATLNSILITSDPDHPHHSNINNLLTSISPICQYHPNSNIKAAFLLVNVTCRSGLSIIERKKYLQMTFQAANSIANNHLACIAWSFMSYHFFRGVIGPQPEQSSRTALKMAVEQNEKLWECVAGGLLAETLEVQDKANEARVVMDRAERLAGEIVPGLMERK
jgi:Cohesin loading factor